MRGDVRTICSLDTRFCATIFLAILVLSLVVLGDLFILAGHTLLNECTHALMSILYAITRPYLCNIKSVDQHAEETAMNSEHGQMISN